MKCEPRKVAYKDMLLHEFREALAAFPVAYIPVGLLEWHGDHLPLGTDILRAEHICRLLADELGGVVLPALYNSVRGFSSYEGTLVFRHETAVTLALELLAQLEKVGFKAVMLLSAHGGKWQEAYLQAAVEGYQGQMAVRAVRPSVASGRGGHAGTSETSEILAVNPDLVDMSEFKYPTNPISQYEVDPEQLCPAETRPWVWKEDVRQTASAAIGKENHMRVVAYCQEWLESQGIKGVSDATR